MPQEKGTNEVDTRRTPTTGKKTEKKEEVHNTRTEQI